MKFILAIILSISLQQISFSQTATKVKPVPIVELFTAEGCSSCPAADDLLKEMADIRQNEGKSFIGLSFHVTYWNRTGWIDSFSNEAYTERQKNYQTTLKLPLLYTPQAIVNGQHEFVGSNPISFRDLLVNAEGVEPIYEITAKASLRNDSLHLDYSLSKAPNLVVLNIAIVQNYAERFITRGENKGRKLKHANVVRSFTSIIPTKSGNTFIAWPGRLQTESSSVVIYLQNVNTLKIIGASHILVE